MPTSVAASFVASDKSWLQIADAAQTGLDIRTNDATVSLTFKPTATPAANWGLINKGAATNNNGGFSLNFRTDNKVGLVFGDGSGAARIVGTFSTVLANGSTYNLILALDRNGVATLCVNGVADTTTIDISGQQGDIDSVSIFYLGYSSQTTGNGSGNLSHVRFWSRILTAPEIARQANMVDGVPQARPYAQLTDAEKVGLVSDWGLQDGPWSASQQAMDLHGTNHLSFAASAIIDATTLNGGCETVTAGTELLGNTGFETLGGGSPDVFASWTESVGDGAIEAETVLVHLGEKAAKLTSGPTSNTQIYETRSVTSGAVHRLSFYAAGDGVNAGRYKVQYYDGVTKTLVDATSTGITASSYGLVSVDLPAIPTGGTSVNVLLMCPSVNGGIAYFDDVSLKPLSPATWTKAESGSSKVQVELAAPYAGSYGIRLDVDGSGSAVSVDQRVVTAGKSYAYSLQAKAASGTPQMKVYDLGAAINFHNLTTAYALYSGSYIPGSNAFAIGRSSATSNSIFLDNITLTAANLLTATGPTTTTAAKRRRLLLAA